MSKHFTAIDLTWVKRQSAWVWGSLFLTLMYVGFYLADPALPGNNSEPCCVTGWIGWGDQGFYYRSMWALAAGNLDPAQHWYPLGYSLLAAPFSFLRSHAFFPVDLASLILAYSAFLAFSRRIGVLPNAGTIVFLLSVCADPLLFMQWDIPWNTTPAAALIWALLATAAGHIQGARRPLGLGLLAAGLPLIRPTDALISTIVLAWLLADDIKRSRLRWREIAIVFVTGAILVVAYVTLHVSIYGWDESEYMKDAAYIGFTLHNPLWRAYVLLIEPRQWFFEGKGLFARAPWLLLGFAGALWVWRSRGPAALLSTCIVSYFVLFIAFVDLTPLNIWKYYLVHYFIWTFPGLGLLAWIFLGDLFRPNRLAYGTLALVFILSCIRVTPKSANLNELAIAIDMPGPMVTNVNDAALSLADDIGPAMNIRTIRILPLPLNGGARFLGIRRDFKGYLEWPAAAGVPATPDATSEIRWREKIGFGYPCWLPPYYCK